MTHDLAKKPRLLLGGSFNPPHQGHLDLADSCAKQLNIPSVTFIPNQKNPLKKSQEIVSAEHRLAMLKILLEKTPHTILTWELEREGPSWTIETVRWLKDQGEGPLYFLIGSDCLEHLHEWKCIEELFDQVVFYLVHRHGAPLEIPQNLVGLLGSRATDLKLRVVEMSPVPISSTQIRESLIHGEFPQLLPQKIANYIKKYGLYQ